MNKSIKLLACLCACALLWTQWPVQGCGGSMAAGEPDCCCAPAPEPEPSHSCCADDSAAEPAPAKESSCTCTRQDVDSDLPLPFVAPSRPEPCKELPVNTGFTIFYTTPDLAVSSQDAGHPGSSPPLHRCSVPAYLANCAFLQ